MVVDINDLFLSTCKYNLFMYKVCICNEMFIFRKVIYDGSSGAAMILSLPVLKWGIINECTVTLVWC